MFWANFTKNYISKLAKYKKKINQTNSSRNKNEE